jgi:hypothetical protein
MQKAHLYEALLLVNLGIDDAVRGLERLKRAKDSGLKPSHFDEKLTLDREHESRALDEVQVDRDVRAAEENRRLEGKTPKVRFLSDQEQRELERPYPKLPAGSDPQGRSKGGEDNRG